MTDGRSLDPVPEGLSRVLDQQDYRGFASRFGPEVPEKALLWARQLLSEGPEPPAFDRLRVLAWLIFAERQGRHFGERKQFEVTPALESFQELIYDLDVFATMKVPFDRWKDVLHSAYFLLADLLDGNVQDFRTHPKAQEIRSIVGRRLDVLLKEPEWEERYCDYLNGAL